MKMKIYAIFAGVVLLHLMLLSIVGISGGCRTNALENRRYIPAVPSEPAGGIEDASMELGTPPANDVVIETGAPVVPISPEKPMPFKVESKTEKYTVQKGDSFWKIARKYGVSMKELAAYNNMPLNKPLKAGSTLNIPPGGALIGGGKAAAPAPKAAKPRKRISKEKIKIPEGGIKYKVRKGDSLWKIAVKYNLKTSTLAAANNIDTRKPLRVGQELLIPGAKAAASAPIAPAATALDKEDISPEVKEEAPAAATGSKSEEDKALDILNSDKSTDDLLKDLPSENTNKEVDSVDDLLGPAPKTKKSGETVEVDNDTTIEAFSAKFGVKPEDIRKLNPGLPKSGKLTSGMIIELP